MNILQTRLPKLIQWSLLTLIVVLLFSSAFTQFFSADDWFHLRISQIERPAAFQEVALVLFVCLSLTLSLRAARAWHNATNNAHRWLLTLASLGSFILALMSKETAAITPFLLLTILTYLTLASLHENAQDLGTVAKETARSLQKHWPLFAGYAAILLPYLWLRFTRFGFDATSDTYAWSLDPIQFLHTIRWYGLWAIGAPEALVDYMQGPFSVLPRFFTDYPSYGQPLLLILLLTIALLLVTVLLRTLGGIRSFSTERGGDHQRQILREDMLLLTLGILWFFMTLGPLLLLPTHRFALELGLPLIGVLLAIWAVLRHTPAMLRYSTLLTVVLLQIISIQMTQRTHYSITRSQISERAYEYFQEQDLSRYDIIYIYNDTAAPTATWGSSRQIQQALMGDEFFRVMDETPPSVIYEDAVLSAPLQKKKLEHTSNILRIPASTFK